MKKMRSYAGILATSMLLGNFGTAALAEEVIVIEETEMETEMETEAEEEELVLSDSWMDYQIQIDGKVFGFPTTLDKFERDGWTAKDEEELEEELQPRQYTFIYMEKEGYECRIEMWNAGINNMKVEDCIVVGIELEDYYWPTSEGEVVLAGGIVRGVSDSDAILEAYGVPSNTYEGSLYTQYTYETDIYCSIELTVGLESGVLDKIDIENFVTPDDFYLGDVSDEVPEEITNYEKPGELSSDLSAYEIEYNGEVYALPVPVQTLMEDGWQVVDSDTDEYVAAHSSGWITMMNGGMKLRTMVRNEEDYATIAQNCWIEELGIGTSDTNMTGSLPGGIHVGMTEEDLIAVLDASEVSYEAKESGDYVYYSYNSTRYDQQCEVTVYRGDNEYYEKNTVISIECSNAFD